MRKLHMFLVLVAVVAILAFTGVVKAENSASSYDAKNITQQVDISIYSVGVIAANDIVALDVTNGTIANKGLGSYMYTTTTTDSVYVMGVADEAMVTGQIGRVCVRGPHLVHSLNLKNNAVGDAAGKLLGTSTTAGYAAPRTNADGTASGILGVVLSATADTKDTVAQWVWVDTSRHQ